MREYGHDVELTLTEAKVACPTCGRMAAQCTCASGCCSQKTEANPEGFNQYTMGAHARMTHTFGLGVYTVHGTNEKNIKAHVQGMHGMKQNYHPHQHYKSGSQTAALTEAPVKPNTAQHDHDTASHRDDHVNSLSNHLNTITAKALSQHMKQQHPGLKPDPRQSPVGAAKNRDLHGYEHHLQDFGTLQSKQGEQRAQVEEAGQKQDAAAQQQQADSHEVAMAQAKAIAKQPAGALGQKQQAITIKIPQDSKKTESFHSPSVDEVISTIEEVLTEEHMCWGHNCGDTATQHVMKYEQKRGSSKPIASLARLRHHLMTEHGMSSGSLKAAHGDLQYAHFAGHGGENSDGTLHYVKH